MDEENGDKTYWLPKDEPILNEFRLAKADIAIDRTCDVCQGSGQIEDKRCNLCRGRGRLFTAWRGHDLDPIENIRFAQTGLQNILTFLHNNRIITDQHAYDGRTYEIWYEIFKATASMQKKPLYGAMRGELANEGLSEYGFILLIQDLPDEYHKHIKDAIYTMQSFHTRQIARRMAGIYEKAFDKLSYHIPLIRERLKVIAEKQKAKEE